MSVIPEKNDVVIDFSMCGFVDHSVMENINDYQELFYKKEEILKLLEWICLGQNPGTLFALRKLLPLSSLIKSGSTNRQKDLEEVGLSFGLNFNSERIKKNNLLEKFSFFKTKKIEYIFNKLSRKEDNFSVFDITFSEGEAIAKEVVRSTMLHINLSKDIPSFTLTKEGLLERFCACWTKGY